MYCKNIPRTMVPTTHTPHREGGMVLRPKVVKRALSLALLAAMSEFTGSVSAASYCEGVYNDKIAAVKADYIPQLEAVDTVIGQIEKIDLDPDQYNVPFEGQMVPATYKYAVLFERFQEKANSAAGSSESCREAAAPAQLAADLGVIWATSGLSLILPAHQTHIDMAAVQNGYPLGTDRALLPKARNDIVKTVTGIDLKKDRGFIGNVIKEPLNPTKWFAR